MAAPSFSYDYQHFDQTINLPNATIKIEFYDHTMCGPLMMVINFNDKHLRCDSPVSGSERMLNYKLVKHLFELSKTVDNKLTLLQRLACFQCMSYKNLTPLILDVDKDATHETNVWSHVKPLNIDGESKYLNDILPLIYDKQVFRDNRDNEQEDDELYEKKDEENFTNSLEECIVDDFITYIELWKYIEDNSISP
jgi:hypothetical protein